MTDPTPSSGPRPSDKWIPYYFFIFFGIMVLTLVPMCVIAVRTGTGVVTDHAYEKGVSYNQDIKAAGEQAALGWQTQISVNSTPQKTTSISFTLTDRDGRPVTDATAQLVLSRPTQAKMDQKADLKETSPGLYTATLSADAGVWDVDISATKDGHNFQASKRVQIQ
ncbi:MAG: FixH family protein [Alphaproteobacteria bacterium]|nr:FixH family protein [Alphaproteobacteria bacterium]MBV8549551.1 FixH family protein [Alphaproteobacteria bacterium]